MKRTLVIYFLLICILLFGCSTKETMKEESQMSYNSSEESESFGENAEEVEEEEIIERPKIEEIVEESEIQGVSPSTITDLFAGEKRIWYYIDSLEDLAYDSKVKAIFVSENKAITEIYYNLRKNSFGLMEEDFDERPNPFAERFELQEFDGISYEQLMEKIKETYVSAEQTYDLDINEVYAQYGALSFDYNKYSSFDAVELPFEISYDGILSPSGNEYVEETIYLFKDASICAYYYFNQSAEAESLQNEFTFSDIVKPTIIKSQEYVGIVDKRGNMLITENTYASFDEIGFDKVIDNRELNNEINKEDTNQVVNTETKYLEASSYSEGMALLRASDFYAFVDKTGKIRIKIKKEIQSAVTSFTNGYAYIIKLIPNFNLAIIDKEGVLRSSYTRNSTTEILAYGAGYVLTQEYVSGFDESYYVIRFYDADGNVIEEKKLDHTIKAKHLGMGIFYIWDYEYNFYCASNDKWTLFEIGKDVTFTEQKLEFDNAKFYQDIAELGTLYDLHDGNQAGICIVDMEGNVGSIDIDSEVVDAPWLQVMPIKNNYCVIYGYGDCIFLYDFASNIFKPLDKYLDKIDWENFHNREVVVGDTRIALPMIGNDNCKYISIFDTDWNMIGDPIKTGAYFGFRDDRLVVKSDYMRNGANVYKIYDINGEEVFEISLADYNMAEGSAINNSYREGALLIGISDGVPKYVDTEGNLLFEVVDDSSAVEIEF